MTGQPDLDAARIARRAVLLASPHDGADAHAEQHVFACIALARLVDCYREHGPEAAGATVGAMGDEARTLLLCVATAQLVHVGWDLELIEEDD